MSLPTATAITQHLQMFGCCHPCPCNFMTCLSALPPADSDQDGFMTLLDFVPLYKTIAAVRRAFRRQDHHNNGQIDR